jgi:hypothetical protein
VTLSKQKIELKVLDEEKRLLMGAALIPNKPIFRRNEEGEEYNIFFSSKTIRKASELFLQRGLQSESTLEHEIPLKGNTVVESWIKEDDQHDKSVLHGLSVPKGTWMVSMKINDDKVWELAKSGQVKGFSIEGYFTDNAIKQSKQMSNDELYQDIMNL